VFEADDSLAASVAAEQRLTAPRGSEPEAAAKG